MYAHLFSVRFKKWRHGGHICFLTPIIIFFLIHLFILASTIRIKPLFVVYQ